jgi:hypothetical protein
MQSNFNAIVYNFYDNNANYYPLETFKEYRQQIYINNGLAPIPLTQSEETYFEMTWEKMLWHNPDMRPEGYSRTTRPPTPTNELIEEIQQ